MAWSVVSGPREFTKLGSLDIDRGRGYTIERGGERRTISVAVASTRGDFPEECQRAIRTRGRSAVDAVLDRDDPPGYIVATTGGLSERHEEPG